MNAPVRVLVVAALALTSAACGDEPGDPAPQAAPRGPSNEDVGTAETPETPQPTARPPEPEPYKSPFEDDTPGPSAPAAEAEKKKEEEERDLGAELKSALGSPVGCLTPRPADQAPDRITIAISAQLVGSGRITRATASASQLEASELDCVRRRVEAIRLRGPVDDAPRGVSTSVELELKTPQPP